MNKFPFTQTGFQSLQTALYQLADEQLKAEADQLRSGFKNWVASHFELSASQLNDLNHISQPGTDFCSYIVGFALENRLPIHLNKEQKGEQQILGSKLIKPNSHLTGTADPEGNFTPGGYVDIEITY